MTEKNDDYWRCYVFVRNDLDSMTPGKIAAQVHHAGTHLVFNHRDTSSVEEYLAEGIGFGTTLVMNGGNTRKAFLDKMNFYMDNFRSFPIGGVIEDPTYPIRDGNTTHLIKLTTCFYILVNYKLENEELL